MNASEDVVSGFPAVPDRTTNPRALAIGVILAVVVAHVLRVGSWLHGSLFRLYYSYASDILVPMAMYFVLTLGAENLVFLRSWWAKAGLVFGAASFAEILQASGVPLLGQTFDPLDFLMFALGTAFAAGLDEGVRWLRRRRRRGAPRE